MKKELVFALCCLSALGSVAQENQDRDVFKEYERFKQQSKSEYSDFRKKANDSYSEFMRHRWDWYKDQPEIKMPQEEVDPVPVPQAPDADKPLEDGLVTIKSVIHALPVPEQPNPIAAIPEATGTTGTFTFEAYGTRMQVRLEASQRFHLKGVTENDVADGWQLLSGQAYNNLLRDCLSLRIKHNLCDWAYLNMLQQLSESFLGKGTPEAVLMQAFLFNQSGYKARLGRSRTNRLYLLVASNHVIYKQKYFQIKDELFYPLQYEENGLFIYTAQYPGEQTMSLVVGKEQKFDVAETEPHRLVSKGGDSLEVALQFNSNLMNFYLNYPQSHINNDETTKWTFFATTPISERVKNQLYPVLEKVIAGKSKRDAANVLIRFVQTAFEYKLDNEVWGDDHPFFAEETLFYPFSDCEDRVVLYATLVRDLLHLDTILLYYPGHLAMAVCLEEEVGGKTLQFGGKTYVYCEPTCSGYAPVGWCPPALSALSPVVIAY